MLTRGPGDRVLPTFITLLVIGVLLMTFDVRLQGGGTIGVLRSGTQALVAPVQKAASFVVNPVADLIESLSNVASLREENAALTGQLGEAQAALVAVQDDLARLELLEELYALDVGENEIGRTVANVIGRPDGFDFGFVIDKGTADGVVVGQPVIDTNGYVVGTIKSAGSGNATVIPLTASRDGITVQIGAQIGMLSAQLASPLMSLGIFDATEPLLAGDRVLTSAVSISYPAGLPVGVVVADFAPVTNSIVAEVRPFVDPELLRLVVVLAWPPDPISAATETPTVTETTTTTEETSTTTTEGS